MTIVCDDFRNHINPAWSQALIFSDPPYNQGYHYDAYRDSLQEDDYADLLRSAFAGRRAVVIHYPEETINVLGPILGTCEQVVRGGAASRTSGASGRTTRTRPTSESRHESPMVSVRAYTTGGKSTKSRT
jgi:hypothetical protein